MSKERTEERQSEKRARIGFTGHRTRLQLSEPERLAMLEDGYMPYWFNDKKGQVQQALAAGYVFVKPEEARSIGESELHKGNTDLGGKVSTIVENTTPPVRAFLMKQKVEHYKEDEAAREEVNAKVDEALRQGKAGGANIENQYGSVELTRS